MGSYSSNFLRLLSYTKRLTHHVNQGRHHQALVLFQEIHSSLSHSLDPFIFPLALKSCAFLHCPLLGASIHSLTLKSSFITNPFVACGLVDMYGKCVSISSARQLFDEMCVRNVVVWNSMISLYTHSKNMQNALQLFEAMDELPNASTFNTIIMGWLEIEGKLFDALAFYRKMWEMSLKPNLITLLALLRACVGIAALDLIKEIHGYSIRNDVDAQPHFRSGLVEAYGRCGCLDKAHLVFESIGEKDVVAWSSLISAYALHGMANKALEIFEQMAMSNVKPDEITFLGVLKACSHSGLANESRMHFSRMHSYYGIEPNGDHYACLVDVLSRAGRLYEAYEVLKGTKIKATAKAWGALLGACRTYGEVELAEVAGRALFEIEPENPANYVLLARIYASKEKYEEAEKVTREMKERGVKAVPGSSWVI
ncbi:putative pentatricopeptide repeat-containing protein At1g03510 [Olea europaea var. sylvestris]|uniref:putative pentatricopeptide repeat-containing protein At1g03510 n=1 Tax=Olea europaea var. sylvestris TaxID=158386 RepID=UPI000C1D785C|nr:putative pentatricopeptide repeat-containing protein At1g03510 [Olea europaea var. sylvestris]